MKKKREAKRQAKLLQEEEPNKVDKKTEEPIDNEKQLRIKKIQSVYNFLIYYKFTKCFYFFIFGFQDLKSINRFKTLLSSGKELDNNQMARLKLEKGLLAELKQLQL